MRITGKDSQLQRTVSLFKAKSAIESFNTLVTHRTLIETSSSNHTNIYKAEVKKVSLGAKLLLFVHSYTGRFLCLHSVKLTVVDRVKNRLTFATVVAP